jgi:hypothetical protein
MLKLKTLRGALLIGALALIVNMALSDVTFAQRGRGRFNDRKSGKFINGHDARDGRFDGRGPRPGFFGRRGPGPRFYDRRGPGPRFYGRRGDGFDRYNRIRRWRR